MKNINKTAILPIVTAVCLGIGYVTGHQISSSLQDEIATIATAVIGTGVTVWGVIKDHKKEVSK
jgi:ribose/xylose/arabinose/galactoside ABC-type transport system permease subunit